MTLDLDLVSRFTDRFGLPVLLLAAIFWLAHAFIRGPATKLAEKLGDAGGALCRAAVDYLAELTDSLHRTHVEHEQLRHQVTLEAASTRAHVTRELDRLSSPGGAPAPISRSGSAGPRSGSRSPMATLPSEPDEIPPSAARSAPGASR